jgi:hypothetical protein
LSIIQILHYVIVYFFEVLRCLTLTYFLCFYIEINSSRVNPFFRSFHQLKSFCWIIFYVLSGLDSSRVDVLFVTIWLGV